MRQVQIPKHGPPEVLRLIEAPDIEPGPGEVRLAVKAAGLNFADVLARKGMYRDAPPPPLVVGYEAAGVIDKAGEGVSPSRLGQRVLAMTRFRGQSSQVIVAEDAAVPMPQGMTFEEGGGLPVAYLTAYHMLIYLGNLHPGERVLVHSAGGGVGIAAIQLARWRGAEIFGTASKGKHERLRELGVEHCIDYRTENFEAAVKKASGGRGVHIALDPVGGDSFRRSYRALGKNGRLFCFGISSFSKSDRRSLLGAAKGIVRTPFFHPLGLMLDNKAVFGVNLGQLWDEAEVMRGQLTALMDLYREGVVKPVIDRAFPAEEAAAAHRHIEDRGNFGKVVLTF
ncbi:MAG: zinc-binding dehydrogenase [Polyangia bacterium]|mgnify:CR=1 FL=1|jgi:NADPH:quinone reductase-like Zn-dependent oxidoreductase|nr:zinc-binding dehydrogenase [Polyangia bacterium]